jgi:hypothetical protein
MKVIGIGGQLGSGKDTLADYLAATLNKRFMTAALWRRIGFAHAVKKVFMDTFNVTWDFIEEWKRKEEAPPGFDKNIRKSLQFIGDGFRSIKSTIWIETAFREDIPKIISDVRYLNEARAIKEHDGINVLVWRPGWENNDPNPSESQIKPTIDWCVAGGYEGRIADWPFGGQLPDYIKDFDFFIRNEGNLDQLYKKVDDILVPAIEEKYGHKQGRCSGGTCFL